MNTPFLSYKSRLSIHNILKKGCYCLLSVMAARCGNHKGCHTIVTGHNNYCRFKMKTLLAKKVTV